MVVLSLNSENFDEKITKQDKFAVVTFSADWCGPCRDFAPKLYSLSKAIPTITVAKVNVDECPALSKQFAVNGVPLTIIFDAGKELERITGNVPEDYLMKAIWKHLPKELHSGSSDETQQSTDSKNNSRRTPSGLANLLKKAGQAIRDAFSHLKENW